MTSNHPEKLDPALIRPGRIDLIVKFDYCNTDEISEIYTGITGDELPLRILNAIPTNKYSPARITQAIFESFENPELGLSKLV
jgi:SpoVK/Ycf46/Vps4 family AAA+-type ATPase